MFDQLTDEQLRRWAEHQGPCNGYEYYTRQLAAECIRLREELAIAYKERNAGMAIADDWARENCTLHKRLAAADALRQFMEGLPIPSDEAIADPQSHESRLAFRRLIEWFKKGDAVVAAYDAACAKAKEPTDV